MDQIQLDVTWFDMGTSWDDMTHKSYRAVIATAGQPLIVVTSHYKLLSKVYKKRLGCLMRTTKGCLISLIWIKGHVHDRLDGLGSSWASIG